MPLPKNNDTAPHRFAPVLLVLLLAVYLPQPAVAQSLAETPGGSIYDVENLVAWCIVPFDAKRRNPSQRAEMVKQLGLRRVAYDWRNEHVPTFETEIIEYQKHGLEFFAFWSWHDALEPLIAKHNIRPQIWSMLPQPAGATQADKIKNAVQAILPLVEKTRALNLSLGLYNHGGWTGQPHNLVAVCQAVRSDHNAKHVGIVYNFHHGHEHIERFDQRLSEMQPYLLCVNLNGMVGPNELTAESKIVPIGSGQHEVAMMQCLLKSGYRGPVGILDHRPQLDAQQSLTENLRGLQRLRETVLNE